ncbi:hypothetical protein [Rhizobium sp.]|uniref:hypothetical protein n=2 Tax=Rhizobium sp. TaxID=391 RepID=UPI0028AA235C
MKKIIALAAMISASTFAAGAYAQDTGVTAPAPSAEAVTIVSVTSAQNTGDGSRLPKSISNPTPDVTQAAQAQVEADPSLMTALKEKNVELNNVVAVDTALNGGKTVYIK